VAQHETKMASADWLNIVRFTGNLNEFNIPGASDVNGRSQFFPRYNISATIPLGIFVNTPHQVRRGRELEQVALHNINSQKLALRAEVMKLYNDYLMHKEIFNLRSQELEEATSNFVLLEQRFKSGEEQYEKYTQGLASLNRVKIDRIQAQTSFLNSKLAIEAYIGIKLEDVK
jgi:outer membrane protein TolC